MRIDMEWVQFKNEWGMRYQNAKHILFYLNSYPGLFDTVQIQGIHNPNNIDKTQKEWLWLCSKFDNPIEKDFFKPYWIPLEVNSFDYFMDISDVQYPIFRIHYFFYEPYKWYKGFIIKDIKELLLAPDTNIDLRGIRDANERQRWEEVEKYFQERRSLGYDGKKSE